MKSFQINVVYLSGFALIISFLSGTVISAEITDECLGCICQASTGCNRDQAYSSCVNDMFCASETIRAYARTFGKDCNGDGVIDCEDYVRIHKLGPGNCDSPTVVETTFYKEYLKCKAVVNPN